MNLSESSIDTAPVSMDKFYPALVQCFGVIFCGYAAGRLKIISNAETKGLNTFVGTFALPSLIFLSLVNLNWKMVNWTFLLSILISKSIVFFTVILITFLAIRPVKCGRAGLLAIFCTQSNDFAIGYPIVDALYKNTHPEFATYLYILAPISLAILNPIGLILLEIEKQRAANEESGLLPECQNLQPNPRNAFRARVLVAVKLLECIFLNPILMMTILGIAVGFVFSNGLPEVISGILILLGKSFTATALFLLGLRIVGNGSEIKGSTFLMPVILIIVKLLVMPLVTRQTVYIMQAGENFTETTELSTFGFLYGTFPAAPGVFVIASQYNSHVDLIAKSMVASTFISAPLMFISAKMISLTNLDPADYIKELDRFSFDISITGIIACMWILLIFIMTKKIFLIPQRITSFLVLSQLFCCVGVILWSKLESVSKWMTLLQFFLFTVGTYSSRLWTAMLAISLLFLQCRSLCFVLKLWPYMILISWGIPALLSLILIIVDGHNLPVEKMNPNFQYGNAQAAIAIFLIVMCFIVTVGCLVLHQRYKKRMEKYRILSKEISNPESDIASTFTANLVVTSISNERVCESDPNAYSSSDDERQSNYRNIGNCCPQTFTNFPIDDIEDIFQEKEVDNCSESNYCPSTSGECSLTQNRKYENQTVNTNEPLILADKTDEQQTLKHIVLLILLLCSMFVALALSTWTLIMEGMSGIYIELSFLDAFLNFGQSLIILAVFITDTGELLKPIVMFWQKIWYVRESASLPSWSEVSSESMYVCQKFRKHHLEQCKIAVLKNKRWRSKTFKHAFFGRDLVSWLLEVGLVKDRIEATQYGAHLIEGRILRNLNNKCHFSDDESLYFFCKKA